MTKTMNPKARYTCHGCGKDILDESDIRFRPSHRPYCSGDCMNAIGREMTSQERYDASADSYDGDSF